jgi:hypothetical protein
LNSNEINDIIAKLEDLKLENKSLKLELKEIKVKKSVQPNTHCDVTNGKSENSKMLYSSFFNEKSQCRRLDKSNSETDTGKWILKSKKRSEKSSNIPVIENKTKENIILTKMPTELEKEIMDEVTVVIAGKEINKNPIEQIALLQVIVTKLCESFLDVNGQTCVANQMINKLTDAQLSATNDFSNHIIRLTTKLTELEHKIKG